MRRVLLAVVVLQALGLLAVAVLVLLSARGLAVAALDVVALVGVAVVLLLLGRSVASGARTARGALVVLELLALAVAYYMLRGGLVVLGVAVGLSGLLGTGAVLAVVAAEEPDDLDD